MDAQAVAIARAQQQFHLNYPSELPVVAARDDILAALGNHQVVVIAGETGSGKTTQLPKLLLELGYGRRGMIGHTQPRRLAARSVAERIASEMQVELGTQVGFKVRFTDQTDPLTALKVMTDGMLLAELQQDRLLKAYDAIIIDEAHERSLNIDFLLGVIKQLLPRRPDLKVVITSATIETEKFSKHFNDAPVLTVNGRTYPVDVRYRPLLVEQPEAKPQERDPLQAVVDAVAELQQAGPGDILIFASGEREIKDYAEALQDAMNAGQIQAYELLPLFARLSAAEQNRVFQPHQQGRVVIATNVAETSLTVPGIRYVIDPGTARISRYSYRTKVQRLPIEAVSQASANQRKGRCGRVAPGICIRLYSEDDFNQRPEFTDPEILRTNLAAVILQMTALRLGDIRQFPFIQKPDERFVNDGLNLLRELQAIQPARRRGQGLRLTEAGRQLARLPLDPRLGRMVLAAASHGCVQEVAVITAALSIQDPRERPREAQAQADEFHRQFASKESDFESYLLLWQHLREQQQALSKSAFRKYCKQHFIHFLRVREWQDIYTQIRQAAREIGLRLNAEAATYEQVHRALLTGLLAQLGQKDEDGSYVGARQSRFYLFPGSGLAKRKPKWVMSAELVETSRLFARVNASLDPTWVEQAAAHLVKRSYLEPRFEKRQGSVVADEQVSLFGLIVVPRRKVQYGPIDPVVARELFIREALVNGQLRQPPKFVAHNLALIEAVQALEDKARRRDILIDEQALFDAYDEQIPAGIYNEQLLIGWYRRAQRSEPELLCFTREQLMAQDASHVTATAYPEVWRQGNLRLPLSYKFEPQAKDDGVTLEIPLALLNQVEPLGFDWLIPALHEELIIAHIKGLPKNLRRNFVPAPNYAQAVLAALYERDAIGEGTLVAALTHELRRMSGVTVPDSAWEALELPAHLKMNFRVLGEPESKRKNSAEVLAEGRDLAQLKASLKHQVSATIAAQTDDEWQRSALTAWSLPALPNEVTQQQGQFALKAFPALVARAEHVDLQLFDAPEAAAQAHRDGVRKLLMLQIPSPIKYLQQKLSNKAKLALYFNPWGKVEALIEDCVAAAIDNLVDTTVIRSAEAFADALTRVRAELHDEVERVALAVEQILTTHHGLQKRLKGKIPLDQVQAHGDIKDQLAKLVYPGFVQQTGVVRLADVKRYLDAVARRLDKLPADPQRDRVQMLTLTSLEEAYQQACAKTKGQMTPQLAEVRWMLEELRVSFFAQQLGTKYPVSEKRIRQALQAD